MNMRQISIGLFLALLLFLHTPSAGVYPGLSPTSISLHWNRIVAYLSYGGEPLSYSNVTIVLNGKYSAQAVTNSSGGLALYAPLSLGRNALLFEYASNEASGSIYYYGGLLEVALILAGILLFLLLKFLSKHVSDKSEVSLTYAHDACVSAHPLDAQRISDVVSGLMHNTNSIMRDAPVCVREVSAAIAHTPRIGAPQNLQERVSALIPDVFYGVICRSPYPYREVIARTLYESAINRGGYALHSFTSVHSALACNSIVPFAESGGVHALRILKHSERIKIATLGPEHAAFRTTLSRGTRGCSFLLFNEINGFLEVMKCR